MLKKYVSYQNYIHKYRKIRKRLLISVLSKSRLNYTEIHSIWKIKNNHNISGKSEFNPQEPFYVFGIAVKFNEINWHKDSFSDYVYPVERIDKLKIAEFFNKDIDIVFTWEQSRFYFAPILAIRYLQSRDENYYDLLKDTILNWIDKNPFLYGVNWFSTMDVAIRAVNWIVAINILGDIFAKDYQFKELLSKTLQQHARFISYFPAVYEKNHITNHTTSAYTALLFLALSLKDLAESKRWLSQAIDGLVKCIEYQVYDDGVDFEGSILYHRLVLELFSYSAIICIANGIHLPESYFRKLYSMFEFTESYMDCNGNAPQVGDNDSGRLLILNEIKNFNFYRNESDHSYLINLKGIIFGDPYCSTNKQKYRFEDFIPGIIPLEIRKMGIMLNDKRKTIFDSGGAYFLKNENYSLLVACFPIGQKGRGGHNHLDYGSFTLSIKGDQVIVDPGSPTYSSNKKTRDLFRSYSYHNSLFTDIDSKINWDENGYWGLKKYYTGNLLNYNEENIDIKINFINDPHPRFRSYSLKDNALIIRDSFDGFFYSRINFHPDIDILSRTNTLIVTNKFEIILDRCIDFKIQAYDYSPHYGTTTKALSLIIRANSSLEIYIKAI